MALKNDNDDWVYEKGALQSLVNSFYSTLYTSSSTSPSQINYHTMCCFPSILPHDMDLLMKEVTFEETKTALFSMHNLKAPGPDGYHPLFFKAQWEVLGHSIFDIIKQMLYGSCHYQGY